MSEQMQEVIATAISRAYESGAHHERSKALIIIDAMLHDAERRWKALDITASGYKEAAKEIKTEIRIFEELKGRISEQAR